MKEYADLSKEEKTLIMNFFAAFDPAFHRNIKQCLRSFIEKKGIFLYENQGCLFPTEFAEFNDVELGNSGVLFVFECPICQEDEKELLVSDSAFTQLLSDACANFSRKYPMERESVTDLLDQFKESFL